MTYNARNRGAATDVPVTIRLTPAERERLLGKRGQELLALALDAIKELAVEEGWPLRQLDVLHIQSREEPDYEYIKLVPEIPASRVSWESAFRLLNARLVKVMESLSEADQDFFSDVIHYGVRIANLPEAG